MLPKNLGARAQSKKKVEIIVNQLVLVTTIKS